MPSKLKILLPGFLVKIKIQFLKNFWIQILALLLSIFDYFVCDASLKAVPKVRLIFPCPNSRVQKFEWKVLFHQYIDLEPVLECVVHSLVLLKSKWGRETPNTKAIKDGRLGWNSSRRVPYSPTLLITSTIYKRVVKREPFIRYSSENGKPHLCRNVKRTGSWIFSKSVK